MIETKKYLESKIKVLNETLWNYKALNPSITKWLENFNNENEKIHALYLLSKFMYFGEIPVKNLLLSLYRDLFRYPIIEEIRKNNNDTLDTHLIEELFHKEEIKTRFLSLGNSSESSAHLLYLFRQETSLSVELFAETKMSINVENKTDITRYIFIDDFCGSGRQATKKKVREYIETLRTTTPNCEIYYLMLFATSDGLRHIKSSNVYDKVDTVVELDDSFKCFDENSRIFPAKINEFEFNKEFTQKFCYYYGYPLVEDIFQKEKLSEDLIKKFSDTSALGWENCQLLIGFNHNTPNNTLPVIWYEEDDKNWVSIFKRFNKKYSL